MFPATTVNYFGSNLIQGRDSLLASIASKKKGGRVGKINNEARYEPGKPGGGKGRPCKEARGQLIQLRIQLRN